MFSIYKSIWVKSYQNCQYPAGWQTDWTQFLLVIYRPQSAFKWPVFRIYYTTHSHNKGFPPSVILKVTVFGTRKWPIKTAPGQYFAPQRVVDFHPCKLKIYFPEPNNGALVNDLTCNALWVYTYTQFCEAIIPYFMGKVAKGKKIPRFNSCGNNIKLFRKSRLKSTERYGRKQNLRW